MGEHPPGARLAGRVGLALAVGLVGVCACEPAAKPGCPEPCAAGSSCVEGQCVADAPAAAPEPAAEPRKKRPRKKKQARRAGAPGAEPGDTPDEPATGPFVPVDDRKIPQFSRDEVQTIDLQAGSERPSQRVLDQHFARITPKITDCVVTASRHGEVGSGRLKVQLRIAPSGKVEAVSVQAPAALDVWGIVPCARKAVYDHRFPAWDGPSVGVDFAVDVD
jgi:hypothetical protein